VAAKICESESTKNFMLHQLIPMRPYVHRLTRELSANERERRRLEREIARSVGGSEAHPLRNTLRRLEESDHELRQECRRLGAIPGRDAKGELLFPCSVDFQEAYFVWYGEEPAPARWRYRSEDHEELIPRHWFTLFASRAARAGRST
jgi:hypothetical protein